MRKLAYFMMLVIGVVTIISCADQKERERNAIAKFVSDSAIHVISEEEFANKGYTTDVSKNEPPSYVAQQTIRQTELLSDVMQE